jgi:hypothetical protein
MLRPLLLLFSLAVGCDANETGPFGDKPPKPEPIATEIVEEPPAEEAAPTPMTKRRRAAPRMRRASPFLEEGAPLDCGERPAEIAHPGFRWYCDGRRWRQVPIESHGRVKVRAR